MQPDFRTKLKIDSWSKHYICGDENLQNFIKMQSLSLK
jgi:hypothetical protein